MSAGLHRDPARWAEQKRATNRALYRAEKRLKARFPGDWQELYEEEAAKEGVVPRFYAQLYAGGRDGRDRHSDG